MRNPIIIPTLASHMTMPFAFTMMHGFDSSTWFKLRSVVHGFHVYPGFAQARKVLEFRGLS